jgi:glycosyltransferase involved in cell wall biosynthesis
VELFGIGKSGGFGSLTRTIGRELVRRNHAVSVIVPQRENTQCTLEVDGMTVHLFPDYNPFAAIPLFKECNADIYHSEEPSFSTYLALQAMPHKKHIITFQDTRLLSDWMIEYKHPSRSRWQVILNYLYEDNIFVHHAVRQSHARNAAAQCLVPKAIKKYKLKEAPEVLYNPVAVPETVSKASVPTVCFIGRWDRVKRPEIFLQLAKEFPDVRFVAVGEAQDVAWDTHLRQTYGSLPNMELPGFIDQFSSDGIHKILSQSWIMVNTSAKEALPVSFLEAAAHRCAILSEINSDDFCRSYGYHAADGDFSRGVRWLIANNRWRDCGQRGYEYVRENFSIYIVITKHLRCYERLLFQQA